MGAMLCDLAVINYQDLISVLDGIQAVGNHQQGLTFYQLRDRLLNIAFIVGVYTCMQVIVAIAKN